ncbi:MAG: hypothetical protein ACOYMN_23020, partial [Roseimicrobium sp.]
MNEPIIPASAQTGSTNLKPRSSWKQTALITLCILFGLFGITAASAAFWYHHNFHAAAFTPVALTGSEQQVL